MIISHKYKFIFIKTQKTAGTSTEVFLSQLCADEDVLTPIHPHVAPHKSRNFQGFWNPVPELFRCDGPGLREVFRNWFDRNRYFNHIDARTVKARTSSRVWNSYFKFCVERNPWDKTLSYYHMLNDRLGGGLSLEDYLQREDFCLNYPKYTDASGSIMVDEVLRYESLSDDLARVFRQLGIPFSGCLPVSAKSEHRKDRRPYLEVFSPEQAEKVAKAFAKEIRLFGYGAEAGLEMRGLDLEENWAKA